MPNACTGVYAPVTKLEASHGAVHVSSGRNPTRIPELMVPSTRTPCANPPRKFPAGPPSFLQSQFAHPGRFRNRANRLQPREAATRFPGAYTIDDGNSLIPLADPLFASYTPLRMQVLSLTETHIFSPADPQHGDGWIFAGLLRSRYRFPWPPFPASLSFVTGLGPGGIVVGGGATTTANGSITSAGPNNAAGVANHRNLFTYQDDLRISHGMHQLSMGVWFQRLQDNEDSASRQLGQATFASLTTFLQGRPSPISRLCPQHTELGWRSLFGAWYVDDSIRLRHNLTLEAGPAPGIHHRME